MGKRKIFDDDSVSEYDMMDPEDVAASEDDEAMDEILDEYEEQEDDEEENESPRSKPTKYAPSPKKVAYSLDKRESGIVDQAMVQLEQAKLYDMFLKTDLFGAVKKINPTAKKRVEKELKEFILERMQILLGLKEDKKTTVVQQMQINLPFNEVEVEFLKALSLKGTGGKSANSKPVKVSATPSGKKIEVEEEPEEDEIEEEEQLTALSDDDEEEAEEDEEEELPPPPKKKKLQPMQAPKKVAKPLPKPAPVKRNKVVVTDEEVLAEQKKLARQGVRLSAAEIRLAKEDIKRMAKRSTPAHLMSEDQLREEAARISGGKKKAPKNALPMPDAAAQLSHYMTQQMQRSQAGDNQSLMGMIAKRLSTQDVHQDNSTGDE